MKRTPLYSSHISLGARMVDFAGWEMPVSYPLGISHEHLAVRHSVGLFDVSHMGELRVLGDGASDFLRFATLNDAAKLKPGVGQYSMLPNDQGGLVDDLYIYRDTYRDQDSYLVVCNAANQGAVLAQLKTQARAFDAHVVDESGSWALLALQGPGSALMLSRHVATDITDLKKNRTHDTELSYCPVRLARTGYTGEDGFEIFCHPNDAAIVWDVLVAAGAVPCGLGARDTLRLEAGFPLYGHEFSATTNPRCSAYGWVVKDKPFFGRERLWDAPCDRYLVGLKLLDRGVARQGYAVYDQAEGAGKPIGEVTSGTISPLTRQSIAMAWLKSSYKQPGTQVWVEVRAQRLAATVVEPPFYP